MTVTLAEEIKYQENELQQLIQQKNQELTSYLKNKDKPRTTNNIQYLDKKIRAKEKNIHLLKKKMMEMKRKW